MKAPASLDRPPPPPVRVDGSDPVRPALESRRAFHQHLLRGWQALTHQPLGTRLVLAWKLVRRKRLEGSLAMLRQRTCPITAAFLSDKRLRERESAYRARRKSSAVSASSSKALGSAGPKKTSP